MQISIPSYPIFARRSTVGKSSSEIEADQARRLKASLGFMDVGAQACCALGKRRSERAQQDCAPTNQRATFSQRSLFADLSTASVTRSVARPSRKVGAAGFPFS